MYRNVFDKERLPFSNRYFVCFYEYICNFGNYYLCKISFLKMRNACTKNSRNTISQISVFESNDNILQMSN